MVQLKLISQTEQAAGDSRIGETIKSGPSPVAPRTASVRNVASAMEEWKNSSRLGQAPIAAPIESGITLLSIRYALAPNQ